MPPPPGNQEEKVNGEERDDEERESEHEDYCFCCHAGGLLLCCDGCPKSFHLDCCNPPLLETPAGTWFCAECSFGVSDWGIGEMAGWGVEGGMKRLTWNGEERKERASCVFFIVVSFDVLVGRRTWRMEGTRGSWVCWRLSSLNSAL